MLLASPRGTRIVQTEGDQTGIIAMHSAFLDLVRAGRPSLTPPNEGLGDLEFVLAAYASMEAGGQPVRRPG